MSEVQELPRGWVSCNLGTICYVERGITFPSSAKVERGSVNSIACLRTTNVQATVNWHDLIYVPTQFIKSENKLVRQKDILISMANSKELVGKVSFVNQVTVECTFGAFIAAIRSETLINSKYLFYYFRTSFAQQKLRETASQTVNIANLSLEGIYSLPISVAPLPEQQRIVEALELQLSRLDAGVAALRGAQKKLKRYRASVLKAAVEGKLTEEWRKSHPETESASKLLTRILVERRAKWEEEQRAKGRDPQKMKYDEPVGPDVKGLPGLPEGWCWATVEQISYFVRYGTSAKTTNDPDGVPVLRMGNIQDGVLDTNNLKYLAYTHGEFPNLFLRKNDLLFNRTNSPELVGKSAVYKGIPSPCSYASYLISVRFILDSLSDYLCFFLNSVYGRTWISSVVSQQVGQANVNGTKLLALTIPLPSLAEQEQIVSLVEERLSIISTLESTIGQVLKRAERMRQSILHKAFTGQLIAQDPNDEPASVLLERIHQEREQAKPPQKVEYPTTRKSQVKSSVRRVAESTQPYLPTAIPDPQRLDTKTTIQSELWDYTDEGSHFQER